MKFIRRAFNFYINASIHVALAVCSLVVITCWEFQIAVSLYLIGFVFFGCISGYNFVKYAPAAGLHHRSLTISFKTIQLFSFACSAMVIFCMLKLPIKVFYVTAIFGLLTFLYTVPIIRKKNLRTLSGFKIFIVGLVWAGVTVLVPWAGTSMDLTMDIWLSFTQRLLLVIVLTLPFEIRDLQYDLVALRTLPQRLGIKRTKGLGIGFLALIVLLEGFKDEWAQIHFWSLLFVCSLTGLVLLVSFKKQSRYFASFWVESIPIMWMLLFIFLNYYFDSS